MPDNELRVSITADASGLSAGLADATAQVAESSVQLASAQLAAKEAAKQYSQALEECAALGEQGARVIDQYKQKLIEQNAALIQAKSAHNAATQSMRELSAATTEETVSQDANNAATSSGISSRQAATASIGILEGRMMSGTRAAGAFLSTTLGLGPALQAAFPIIGAVALGMVLVDIGKGIVKFASETQDLANETGIGWLDAAIGQLDGLKEAVKQADDEVLHLEQDNDRMRAAAQQHAVEAERAAHGQAASLVLEQQQKLAEVNAQKAILEVDRQAVAAAQEELARASEHHKVTVTQGFGTGTTSDTYSASDAAKAREGARVASEQLQNEQTHVAELADEYNALSTKITDATLPVMRAIAEETIKAAHAGDEQLLAADQITAKLNEELALHRAIQQFAQPGTAEASPKMHQLADEISQTQARNSLEQLEHDNIQRWFEEDQKAEATANSEQERAEKAATEEWKKDHAAILAASSIETEAAIKGTEDQQAAAEREIQFRLKLGEISQRQATQELQDVSRVAEAQKVAALNKEAGLYDPTRSQEELNKYNELENRMTELTRKGALEREQITQQETLQFITKWKQVTAEFNSDFTKALNQWATHAESSGKAFGSMLGSLETQLMDFVAKYILQKTEMWAMDELLQVTGLAKQKATSGAAAVITVSSDAAVAAAGAMAFYSAINPIAAPALAAAQYGMTMAYAPVAAFAAGGMVSGPSGMPIPILAHAGERVLSAGQTSNFESMVNGSRSSSSRLNYSPTFNGMPGITHEQAGAQAVSMLRRMVRPEALA